MKLWHDEKHSRVYVFYRTGDCMRLPLESEGVEEHRTIKTSEMW